MKEFTTAAVTAVEDEEREAKIVAYVAEGMTRDEAEAKYDSENEAPFVEFKMDGRTIRAYTPTPGQLTFLLASMGRGQTRDSRFSSIVNIMMETFDEDGRDYLESRLITRIPSKMLQLESLEKIFEHLVEEWFSTPTQEQ